MAYIPEFDPITGYRTDDPSAPRYIPGKLYPRNHLRMMSPRVVTPAQAALELLVGKGMPAQPEFDPVTGLQVAYSPSADITPDQLDPRISPLAPNLTPDQPNPSTKQYIPDSDPATGLRMTMPSTMTPDQLDPLDAVNSPIRIDPQVKRLYATRDAMIRRLVANGATSEEAARQVDEQRDRSGPLPEAAWNEVNSPEGNEALRQRIARGRAQEKRLGIFEDNYNEATGFVRPETAAAPVAPEEPTVSPETIREYGYMSQAEPGPRKVLGGGKPVVGKQFNKMSEAIDYMTRPPVMDANRHLANPGAAYLESPRDRDMRLRGFFPVFADDGSVSYSVGTGQNALYPKDKGIPGGLGRLGPRKDLQETDPSQPGFILDKVDGPTGRNYIYKQNAAARDQQAAYMTERQLYRMAEAAGMSPAEFAAQNEGAFGAIAKDPEAKARMMVQGKRQADEAERLALWKSQMMLAGGRPTGGIGGSKAASVAYNQLNDPNANNWQRAVMAKALVPELDNTTPLTADAMGAQNAMRFVNNRNFGANGTPDPSIVEATREKLRRENREADPLTAGREDLVAGDLTSPMSMKESYRLATLYDSGDEGAGWGWWGVGGMSDKDEGLLAEAFVRDYKMGELNARRAARLAADRRRLFFKRGPISAAGAAPPPAQGAAPPARAVVPIGTPAPLPAGNSPYPGDF
jgi:hypothetical protein